MESLIPNNLGYVKDIEYVDESLNIRIKSDQANSSEQNRVLYLYHIRSLLRLPPTGKIQPPRLIYNTLSKENSPLEHDLNNKGTPSRLFEFIPVVFTYQYDTANRYVMLYIKKPLSSFFGMKMDIDRFHHLLLRFSYSCKITDKKYLIKTNMRACLNAGIPYSYIPYNTPSEIDTYKIVEIYAPYFALTKIMEHTLLSKEIKYEKNETKDSDYWYPSSIDEDQFLDLKSMTQDDIYKTLKQYKLNKEIYGWAIQGWRKKNLILGGWNEDLTWKHLFLEKNARTDRYINMTPKEVSSIVKTVKDHINRQNQY